MVGAGMNMVMRFFVNLIRSFFDIDFDLALCYDDEDGNEVLPKPLIKLMTSVIHSQVYQLLFILK